MLCQWNVAMFYNFQACLLNCTLLSGVNNYSWPQYRNNFLDTPTLFGLCVSLAPKIDINRSHSYIFPQKPNPVKA